MKKSELKAVAARGEDSQLQFKRDIRNADALAAELVALTNSEGGRILVGVTDAGELAGISRPALGRVNQLISNVASQHVRSPISPITENVVGGEKTGSWSWSQSPKESTNPILTGMVSSGSKVVRTSGG